MQLEFYSVEELKKAVLEIVGKYLDLNLYKIFFFGSRVSRLAGSRADIDIGIEGAAEVPVEIKLKIEEELEELPTLYKLDFVDFGNVSDKFKREAMRNVEYVR